MGAWEGDTIVDLNRAFASYLRERGENSPRQRPRRACRRGWRRLSWAGGDAGRRAAGDRARGDARGRTCTGRQPDRLSGRWGEAARALAGRRIACMGGNSATICTAWSRAARGATSTVAEVIEAAKTEGQWGFWKVPARCRGPDDDVPYPERTRYFDYEGEAAIVIGKRGATSRRTASTTTSGASRCSTTGASATIHGHPKPMSYNLAKNFDGSTSMGPCIVVGELDPAERRRGAAGQRPGAPALQHAAT